MKLPAIISIAMLLLLASPAWACYAPFGSGGCGTDVVVCTGACRAFHTMHPLAVEVSGAKPVDSPISSLSALSYNGLPCATAHNPFEADEPVTIKCNGTNDGANWQMAQDIALKYKTKVKIGPDCHIKPNGKIAGMETSSIILNGTSSRKRSDNCLGDDNKWVCDSGGEALHE